MSSIAGFIDSSGLAYLVFAGISLTIGIISYNGFFECDYIQVKDENEWSSSAGYTVPQFVSLVIGTFTLPLGLIYVLVFAVQSFKYNQFGEFVYKILAYCALTALSFTGALLASRQSHSVLSCGVFCFGTTAVASDINGAAIVAINMIYFFVCIGIFSLFLLLLLLTLFSPCNPATTLRGTGASGDVEQRPLLAGDDDEIDDRDGYDNSSDRTSSVLQRGGGKKLQANSNNNKGGKSVSNNNNISGNAAQQYALISKTGRLSADAVRTRKNHSSAWRAALLIIVFLGLYPLLVLACTALPTWWSGFSSDGIESYQANIPNKAYGSYVLVTVSRALSLKLFPDIVLFYGAIYAVSLTALVSQWSSSLRDQLHLRPTNFPAGLSVGEVLLGLTFATLTLSLFLYWYYDHGWEQTSRHSRTNSELAARSIGQVANMVVGLLVLPVSRNSVWTVVFGVSWEYMITFHKWLGALFVCLIVTHVLLWWRVYAQQNSFPHDIFAVPMDYHSTNFTIPLAVIVTLTVMLLLGGTAFEYLRRVNYDIFYWTHHIAMVLFLMMLWHSTMSWYYLTGGLVLWTVDHAIRIGNVVGTEVMLEHLTLLGDDSIIHIGYTVSKPNGISLAGLRNPFGRQPFGPLPHAMGQYVFINIPLVSQLAWHPFSLSSAPTDSISTHHIKAQGEGQWTARVRNLAKALAGVGATRERLRDIVVNVDGPYGVPLQTSRYRNILLVAGGIGITPLFAIYKHMFLSNNLQLDRWSFAHIKKVRLVWVVKTYVEAVVFEEQLRGMHDAFVGLMEQGGGGNDVGDVTGAAGASAKSRTLGNPMAGPLFSYMVHVTKGGPMPGTTSGSTATTTSSTSTTPLVQYLFSGGGNALIANAIASITSSLTGSPAPNNTPTASANSFYNNGHDQSVHGISEKGFAGGGGGTSAARFKTRRPDLQAEILALSPWGMGACVFVCGPSSLAETCSRHCGLHGVDFKQESFEL